MDADRKEVNVRMPVLDKVVTVSRTAREIGVSEGRVRQLVDAGRLRATRGVYGERLIDRRSLDDFLAKRKQAGEIKENLAV